MDVETGGYGWFGAGWEGDEGLARGFRVGGGAGAKIVDVKLHGCKVRLVCAFKIALRWKKKLYVSWEEWAKHTLEALLPATTMLCPCILFT